MNRRMLGALAAVVVAAALVVPFVHADQAHHAAGNMAAKSAMKPMSPEMQQMMAEMMKCEVCKNLAMHMDVLGPVMKNEAVPLSDGMAEMHTITDPSKLQLFRDSCAAMNKAGAACMTMTDEEASQRLCSYCQGMRSAMKAGAHMSQGETKNGTLMVLTSSDPAVKTQIDGLFTKCAMMNNM
jgi:hypothetical protein